MTRRILSLLFVMLSAICSVSAQVPKRAVTLLHYALDSFSTGKVLLTNGTAFQQMLNYNTLTGEMIFISPEKKFLAIANPQEVDTVFIGSRRFVPVMNKFCEWLGGTQPALFKEYTCTIKDQGTNTGFGNTNTAAQSSLNNMAHSGKMYELNLPAEFELLPATAYYLRSKGKYYKFGNAQQASKSLLAKKDAIDQWLKNRSSKFSSEAEVIQFVQTIQE